MTQQDHHHHLHHHSRFCKGCWQQKHVPIPLRGVASAPFRLFGIRPSQMNPNTCTLCELMFTKLMKARSVTVDATVLFADLRNYTRLAQSQSPEAIRGLLDAFYDECASAIWDYDGILNKTIGDAVMAVFNFPISHEDHPKQAILAARTFQERWAARHETLAQTLGITGAAFGVGIGLHCGTLNFGEFGHSHRDLTAIGTVVNLASRVQSAAAPGEILVTRAIYERAPAELTASQARQFELKGFEGSTTLYAA